MRTKLALVLTMLLVAAACSSPPDTVATINGVEIARERLESLHPDGYELVADETASSILLLLIHEAFYRSAEQELGLSVPESDREAAFAGRTQAARGIGDIDEVLANRGVTADRVQLEADLDALQAVVGPHLVRQEADGFDLGAAYEDYVKTQGRVCVRQILLGDTENLEDIIDRANGGESFADLAREFSIDNLAQRPEGESGAGGDMGCSFPDSFGLGLSDAAIDETVAVGEAFGPVISDRGLHVMVVYERELPELEAVRSEVVESAVDSQGVEVFRLWAVGVLESADVTIHESYGDWGAAEGTNGIPTVLPPG